MSRISNNVCRRTRQVYRRLNDSPRQRRCRRETPCLAGAMRWNPQGVPARPSRHEMRRVKSTGFSFVRSPGDRRGGPIVPVIFWLKNPGPLDLQCKDANGSVKTKRVVAVNPQTMELTAP